MSRRTSPCNPSRCGSQTRAPITNRDTTKGSPLVDVQGGGRLFGIRTCCGLGPAFAPACAPAFAQQLWRAGSSYGAAGNPRSQDAWKRLNAGDRVQFSMKSLPKYGWPEKPHPVACSDLC
jgi:hypothetical protein